MRPPDAKLQRWIDLLAALLGHRYGVTFAELKALVPAYGDADGDGEGNGKDAATLARMFERDKDELRALGLPIRVRGDGATDGGDKRYVVKPREMYLPYVALVSRSTGSASAPRVPPPGYREVPTLVFEPDELSALVRAVRKAKAAGDPVLARDAESAMQKLSYDLGAALGVAAQESQQVAVRAPEASAAPAVMVLGEGLLKRKQVTFAYRSMSRDVTETRTVEPYGLFFINGHWYLAGRDTAADALRNFRVSRMESVTANAKKPQSADYEISNDFDLAEHARTREPWELGEDPPEDMIVELRDGTGAGTSVQSLGAEVAANPAWRRVQVRRADSFARWLMSFAGDVAPVSPPRLRDEYRAIVASTLAVYDDALRRGDA